MLKYAHLCAIIQSAGNSMKKSLRKHERRKNAQKTISNLMDSPEHVIIIHYSCESFYDRPDGTSPRITSIAVRNLASGQSTSFSIHQKGEINGFRLDEIEQNYNDLEKDMLDSFYEYVRNHSNYFWLHWNMRNIDYGFQAIAHRYRVLGGEPFDISESKRVNLASLLTDIYGSNYIPHQRLPNIAIKNNITHTDFLSGADEAAAFDNQEYVKLHRSTLRKVEVLARLVKLTDDGSLKTNAKWRDIYGLHPRAFAQWFQDSWVAILFGVIASLASIIGLILFFLDKWGYF